MNLKLSSILLYLIVFTAYGAEIEFIKPCSQEALVSATYDVKEDETVGSFSIKALEALNIEFKGNLVGLQSIVNTPVGLDAFEVISDKEMFAYGWCYSINGEAPELMPNEVKVMETDYIKWWFGFAQYRDGQWITQCTSSHLRKKYSFCSRLL